MTSLLRTNEDLKIEQAAAAYQIDRHVSVTAGPGSGKTTVLVERYLHILSEQKLSIDQIVAITFTNRAANEMRERLRERLNQILQTASGDERRRWLNYKRTLDGAVITTIHGFCARLLREFPVEARVDPQFLLLDEHRAAMLLESVVEEALTEFINTGHAKISRLTLGVGRGKLAAALAQLYREVRGQGQLPADLALKAARGHATEDDHRQAIAELSQTMGGFLGLRRTTLAAKANHADVISAWSGLQTMLQTIPEPETLADYCRAVEAFRNPRPQARGDLKPYIQALDELVWEKDLRGRVPQICLDLFAKQYALEMVHLLTRIDARLNEEKQKLSALDFDDLELRALELLTRHEVLIRAGERYKFFLVDEFQDTNGLQRQLLEQLAFQKGRRASANLFIVGDRKQSIYGFRGADVDVFREMTDTMVSAGGESKPLLLNFRSQPPLINFFNYLFERLFQPGDDVTPQDLEELGYVAHEPSEPKREPRDSGPLVELLITTEASGDEDDPKAEQTSRELDAEQLAQRILSLVDPGSAKAADLDEVAFDESGRAEHPSRAARPGTPPAHGHGKLVKYSDIALLFRAMTHVQTYESAFRRANIPYQTVLGRGFYEREEITDLIQLLRFLDNKTDELALAAVLRSPLGGISDNALLALRCAPWLDELDESGGGDPLRHFSQTRPLFQALRRHRDIAFISDPEHELLDRAADLIKRLIARRHHYSLGDLLRLAVEQSEFMTVIAANFDGAQRLANVQRLFTLAERFERAGTHLIRDFVRYVEEFEAIGSRESEGQIDEAANAVRLMTIHQAKGLEFPVVIIPELQRYSKVMDNWFLLDRHRGLTLKVPDGRGKLVAGCTFNSFEQRHASREHFESMRLLYVAATRAEDRLIFSGTTKDLASLSGKGDTWLKWIWQSLGLEGRAQSGVIDLTDDVQVQLTLNLAGQLQEQLPITEEAPAKQFAESAGSLAEAFPLLPAIKPELDQAVHRFSVTQLINHQRCPRQYYFDHILHVPSADELAVWNDADAPEPPANLTATLKGAVIHRFCETYLPGEDPETQLRASFQDVLSSRQAQLADRLLDIKTDEALKELMPLVQNYLSSPVFQRIERARKMAGDAPLRLPEDQAGLWSELAFRLRRPLGILTGTIDKLLVSPAAGGAGFEIEIIDFKTNRIGSHHSTVEHGSTSAVEVQASRPANNVPAPPGSAVVAATVKASATKRASRPRSQYKVAAQQFQLNFGETGSAEKTDVKTNENGVAQSAVPTLEDQVRLAAADYQLQMQAYALAVRELMPNLVSFSSRIKVTLHFLHPNVEWSLTDDLLAPDVCAHSIDDAMKEIISSSEPQDFPVQPATHCRMCSFLRICEAGRHWTANRRATGALG